MKSNFDSNLLNVSKSQRVPKRVLRQNFAIASKMWHVLNAINYHQQYLFVCRVHRHMVKRPRVKRHRVKRQTFEMRQRVKMEKKILCIISEVVWVVFNNLLLLDATDRSKISRNPHQMFFGGSLYPHSFFTNSPFNYFELNYASRSKLENIYS